MLPVDTPKLPKWPFLVGDASLLGLAWLIATTSSAPLGGLALTAVAACVVVGAILAVIPFLSDYARRQDEALDERQRSLDGLARTVTATAEQISIAANGLHEIAALAQRNLNAAETLTRALESRGGTTPPMAKIGNLDQLQSASDKVIRAVESLAKTTAAIETLNAKVAARSLAASTPEPFDRAQGGPFDRAQGGPSNRALAGHSDQAKEAPVDAPAVSSAEAVPARGMPAISVDPFIPPSPDVEPAVPEVSVEPVTTQAITPEKPKRLRKPRERKPESTPSPAEIPALNGEVESSGGVATAVLEENAPADVPALSPVEAGVVERVRTSDGATRVIVTAYIGIGNRLFIRGEGPGLNWDTGLPLQFVSIGRWRWETSEAIAPVKFKLYKNDAIECTSLGEQAIDPGQQEEITALF